MKHLMLDIETLSLEPNATIISIGAVSFDPYDAEVPMERFHVGIDPKAPSPAVQRLFAIDASTVEWWLHADRAPAREAWNALQKVDLGTALEGFAQWVGQDRAKVWGNAPSFDCVLLRTSYKLLGLQCPFEYRDEMDYRTMKNLVPTATRPADGLAHDALADAIWQAQHLQSIFAHLEVHGLPFPKQ